MRSVILRTILCLILCAVCTACAKSDVIADAYCLSTDDHPYKLFATKTPYEFVHWAEDDDTSFLKGCTVEKLWLLSRHGTRYPAEDDIKLMTEGLPKLQKKILYCHHNGSGVMCYQDISLLSNWTSGQLNVTWDSMLAPIGEDEMRQLGQRVRMKFGSHFPDEFSNDTFQLQHTNTQRTEKSSINFVEGFFGVNDTDSIFIPPPKKTDYLLKFYDYCSKYIKEVKKNSEAQFEESEFKFGNTGIKNDLSVDELSAMYTGCRYEKSWRPKEISAWCTVFTPELMKVIEYLEDLEYYYEDGYGHIINYQQACLPVADLLDLFSNTTRSQKAAFYFTHSGAINKVIARLGLFYDSSHLTHEYINRRRRWRCSLIDPFGSNILAVLSTCGNTKFVHLLVNEKLVEIPSCSQTKNGGCEYQTFFKIYNSMLPCNFDEICENEPRMI